MAYKDDCLVNQLLTDAQDSEIKMSMNQECRRAGREQEAEQ